jgi:hypothetical protein
MTGSGSITVTGKATEAGVITIIAGTVIVTATIGNAITTGKFVGRELTRSDKARA